MLGGAIYGRRFAKYVLLRLEYLLASHAAPLNLPDEISVEHILPQNPDKGSQWVKDFNDAEREDWLHRLGNLMLLSRRKNTSLGNLTSLTSACVLRGSGREPSELAAGALDDFIQIE